MRFVSTLVVACLLANGAVRAEPPRVKIVSARAGYPDARNADSLILKFAAWAPLEVELERLTEDNEPLRLSVETPDADGVMTMLTTPIEGKRRSTVQSYLRPAAGSGETTVTVLNASNVPVSDPYRIRNLRPKDSLTYVVLALGSRFPNFELVKPATGNAEAESAGGPLRGGRVELAAIEDVSQLPDQWFAYETADLVILSTTSAEFVKKLTANESKMSALREWVRRGGRLVITAGTNARLLQNAAFAELLPSAIAGTREIASHGPPPNREPTPLPLFWSARETSQSTSLTGNLALKEGSFPITTFGPKPSGPARIVIPPASRLPTLKEAVAVQAAFGLGRVTLIGFDLDRPPFTEFSRQAEFWDWVLREGGAGRASVGSEGKPRQPNAGPTDDEDEVAVALRTHADTFEAIPVVSFGSVAFLIVLYILIIGPIEYYFLKRVLGRLELTWITFPIIVVTVCVAAMLSASAMKGHDLRVNKIDVIDVTHDRVSGTTWFTLFSPKIDNYSPRVLPAEGWTKNREESASLVGWVGSPRAGRAGLLQRKYAYHTDGLAIADGLDGVPVQVWSTKSFSANWAGEIDSASPVVESRLEHPIGDPSKAIGTFVNRMPFEAVTDCVAFYAGQAYPIGTIVNGQEVRLVLDRGQPASQWLQDRGQLADLLSRGNAFGAAASAASGNNATKQAPQIANNSLPLWGMLFHEAALRNDEGVIPRNASLRRLDQSWRLAPDYRSEVIVVGRVLPPAGTIDDVFNGKESPSRLLLKGGQSLPGYARQETYVRLFLKVQASGGR